MGQHAHGHAHGHGRPASPRVRRMLLVALLPFALVTLLGLVLLWPEDVPEAQPGLGIAQQTVRGVVTAVRQAPCDETVPVEAGPVGGEPGEGEPGEGEPGEGEPGTGEPAPDAVQCTHATVRLTSGPVREDVPLALAVGESSFRLRTGLRLVLGVEPSAPVELRYRVIDLERTRPMLLLGLVFAVAVVLLGRWRGLAALAGLAVSLLVLVKFVLPAFLAGANPLPVAIVGAAAIMFVAVFLAHGITARTSVAVLGTLVSLVVTGVLAAAFVAAGQFTGLATEDATFLRAVYGQVDVHGLLLAGIIIGSLGVLDDVTVTQASAVWELRNADPGADARTLYRAGLRIGRDHIASTVNTLVLAYAGASLPLLLLFTVAGAGVGEVLTSEVVAQEVVRTLVGSVGLVASVPVTTALAAYVVTRDKDWTPPEAGSDETDEWLQHLRATWRDTDGDDRPRPA